MVRLEYRMDTGVFAQGGDGWAARNEHQIERFCPNIIQGAVCTDDDACTAHDPWGTIKGSNGHVCADSTKDVDRRNCLYLLKAWGERDEYAYCRHSQPWPKATQGSTEAF
jgi:hypothetical protein